MGKINKKINKKEEFQDFVWYIVHEIFKIADLPEHRIDIIFKKGRRYVDGGESVCRINSLPEYQSLVLVVFKKLEDVYNEGDLHRVIDYLCHEIGHVHLRKLGDLTSEPYKSERECVAVEEEVATKIGGYLYRLMDKDKVLGIDTCQCHKKNKKKVKKLANKSLRQKTKKRHKKPKKMQKNKKR